MGGSKAHLLMIDGYSKRLLSELSEELCHLMTSLLMGDSSRADQDL